MWLRSARDPRSRDAAVTPPRERDLLPKTAGDREGGPAPGGGGPASLAAACLLHAALALIVLGVTVTRPMQGIPQPLTLRLWFPLGFAVSSLIVYAAAARLGAPGRRAALATDLVCWLALPACVIASRLEPSWTPAWLTGAIAVKTLACLAAIVTASKVRESARWVGVALSAQFLNVSLVTLPYTRYPGMPNFLGLTGDEPHYLALTAALLYDRSFYVGRIYRSPIFLRINGAYIPYRGGWQYQTRYVGNGHYALAHDFGLSILAVPLFALGGKLAVMVAMAVLAAATVYLTYRLVLAVGVRSEVAAVTVSASCFLLPFLPYATQVFPEIPMAFVAVATACYLVGRSRSGTAYSSVTVLLAILPWIHTRAWGLLLPLLAGLVLSERSWSRRVTAPVAVMFSELAYLLLLRAVMGRFVITPIPATPLDLSTLTATKLLIALESPFLDPDNALFFLAPVLLIAFGAWPVLVRQVRGGWTIVAAVAVYSLELGVTHLVGATAAYSPPGRLMVACIPLLAPALALGLTRLRMRGLAIVFWLCAGYGTLLAVGFNANRTAGYLPGLLRSLGSLLQIRGPTLTITGHGPWYAGLAVVVVVAALALLICLQGDGQRELGDSRDLPSGAA